VNEASIVFHEAQGWTTARIDDYAGPARPRIVMHKQL
jgi:hypothetical protein